MKYHNLKVRKVRRTLGPNLEPPEPFDCPQKPNLEPTEPPKMAEPPSDPDWFKARNTCMYFFKN